MLENEIKLLESQYSDSLKDLDKIKEDEEELQLDKDLINTEINKYKSKLKDLKSEKAPIKEKSDSGEIDIATLARMNTSGLKGQSTEAFEAFLRSKDTDGSNTISSSEAS